MEQVAKTLLRLVTSHGVDLEQETASFPTWNCPLCQAELALPQGVPADPADRLCFDCAKPKLTGSYPRRLPSREAALESCGVPPAFRVPFVEPEVWPTDQRTRDFDLDLRAWRGNPWAVTIAGVVRGGKTMLATEILWRALPWVRDGFWVRAGTAVSTAFGRFGDEAAQDMYRRLYQSEILVFDDLGRGHDGRAWSFIVELVSHRHESQMPTLFTTNRRIRHREGDKEPGLSDEDPALWRRLEEGAIVGILNPWMKGKA